MEQQISNLDELKKVCEDSVGYMVGLTTFDGKHVRQFYFTKDFPRIDVLASLKKIKQLAIEDLENPEIRNIERQNSEDIDIIEKQNIDTDAEDSK